MAESDQGNKYIQRECYPAKGLTRSYYHGACASPLSGDRVCDVLDKRARVYPDTVIYRIPEFHQQLTVAETKIKADALSRALLAVGMKMGDLLFLLDVPDQEFILWHYAALRIGVIFLCPQVDTPKEKDTQVFCDLKPKCVFLGAHHTKESRETVLQYKSTSDIGVTVVASKEHTEFEGALLYEDFLRGGQSVSQEQLELAAKRVSSDDLACLLVSSGSTSAYHKIAAITHHFLVNTAKFAHQRQGHGQTQIMLSVLNPSVDDCNPMVNVLRSAYHMFTLVLTPSPIIPGKPDCTEKFLDFLQKEKITYHSGLPFELMNAALSPNRPDYDIKLIGGSLVGQLVSQEMKQIIMDAFPQSLTMFGSTEALVTLGLSASVSTPEHKLETVGYGYPHNEIKLVNDSGEIVDIGQQGEICVRGWTVLKQYYNDHQLTAQALHVDRNRWYHFGDLGIMDETGHVTILGRKSECVRYKHFSDTVYPSKLLEAARKDTRLAEVKVIGIANDQVGDDVCLCVQPKEGLLVTEQELEQQMEQELMENMRPDFCFVFESFPRTGSRQKLSLGELKTIVSQRILERRSKLAT